MPTETRPHGNLSLHQARLTGRLQDFITEQESQGIAPANKRKFNALVKQASREPRLPNQTSGFRARGGSSGKKTP